MIKRKLSLPAHETFFLWGPRQSGKSTLLKESFPFAPRIDLLKAEEFRRYLEHPEYLRTELPESSPPELIVIDEIQKVPQLLDEVHGLIENRGIHFALCGSSARKVRKEQANLLGGRAIRYELYGLVSAELGKDFDLHRMLNHGYLPRHYLKDNPQKQISAYVADYLQEEVAAESLVRNLPGFSNFLNAASLSDTELVNFSTIARDCGVSSHTIQGYFEILTDTLLGRWMPAFKKRSKRRVIGAPKFYFFDVGIVNFLAKRKGLEPGGELYGKAFENWVFHELTAYNMYRERYVDLSYWRLASGIEVDFIVNDMELALEAKASEKITSDRLKGLRNLVEDYPRLKKRFVVSLEKKMRRTEDGIVILPVSSFTKMLWEGEIF